MATWTPAVAIPRPRMQISVRGALQCLTLVAALLGTVHARAWRQMCVAHSLANMHCEVGYTPVFPVAAKFAAARDSSRLSFHFFSTLTSVKAHSVELVEGLVASSKDLDSVKEIELCVGGSCGLSYGSGFRAATRIEREWPRVKVKVTGNTIIPIVG